MEEIFYFVPGESGEQAALFPGFDPLPQAVTQTYLEACTRPGDLLLDPFCRGPDVLCRAVSLGRRIIGSNHNPLAVRLTQLALTPPTRQELDAAVTRLGAAPRVELAFREHIESLYSVRCPRCDRASPADAFTWKGDALTLLHTRWRCLHCGHESAPPTLGDEKKRGETIEQRGLHYWYALDRIAPAGDPLRARAQRLLELYTPRNLYALSSILMKIEGLFADDHMQQALKLLLLSCLRTCSSLYSPESSSVNYRLRRPARFVERNVWRAFVAAAAEFPTSNGGEPFSLAQDPDALFADEGSCKAALFPLGINRLAASLPPGCAALIVASPPRPDPAFWALSWLWTGWLFGRKTAQALRPLAQQRRVDWDWYARTMRSVFGTLRPLLAEGAPLLLLFESPERAMIEALTLALAGAGYEPGAWLRQADTRACRLASYRASPPSPPPDAAGLADALCAESSDAVRDLLAAHGEPLSWDELCLPVYRRLAARGLLGQAAISEELPSSPREFVAGLAQDALSGAEGLIVLPKTGGDKEESTLLFLDGAGSLSPPLSTRVEASVHQLLLSNLILTTDALFGELYRRFPGDFVPQASLIEICLRSYGQEITPGHWQLRLEDQPERRAAEIEGIRQELRQLGEHLGFGVSLRSEPGDATAPGRLPAFDVLWRDEGRPAYAFAIQWTARLYDLLLAEAPAGVQPCLVIPGGRAELVAYKLERDPRLSQAVAQAGWQFVKYRHLRRILAEEDLDRHLLKQIFGLDPIIERDGAQMPLF